MALRKLRKMWNPDGTLVSGVVPSSVVQTTGDFTIAGDLQLDGKVDVTENLLVPGDEPTSLESRAFWITIS